MKKKLFVFFLILGISLVIGGVSFFAYRTMYASSQSSPLSQKVEFSPSPPNVLITWEDQAQFSFQYPKSLSIDPHDEDQENYAHVELTNSSHPGRLIVWTKDSTASDIEQWLKKEKTENALDTTLGEEKAKKILISEEKKRLITSAIRDGYLYQIEVDLDEEGYWNNVYDTISSSFQFTSEKTTQNSQTTSEGTPSGEEGNWVDEEIIE